MSGMQFRKLRPEEHGRTRALYEHAFPEDDQAFVDYYYTWKTKDNQIYAAEDDQGIHAMVHLNPFQVSVFGQIRTLHYIVAVATETAYRHRGLMRTLLEMAMQEMTEAGEPFTFLMPAAEAIYLPFGFRFAGAQRRGMLSARRASEEDAEAGFISEESEMLPVWKNVKAASVSEDPEDSPTGRERETDLRPAESSEYETLARMANETLARQADIFVWRDASYYKRLAQEQRCQGGDVLVIAVGDEIVGTFCTSSEEKPEMSAHAGREDSETFVRAGREAPETSACEGRAGRKYELRGLIVRPGYEAEAQEALQRFADRNGDCRVFGCPEGIALEQEEHVPLLMMRGLADDWKGNYEAAHIYINETV